MKFLAIFLSLIAAKETLIEIEGIPSIEEWETVLNQHEVVIAGYSYCFFAK